MQERSTQNKTPDLDVSLQLRYLGKMLQHHLLLSFTKRRGRKQLLLGINFIQVFTGDGRLIYHLTSRCLQSWDKTKRIPLKEPVRFVFQVYVDGVMPKDKFKFLIKSTDNRNFGLKLSKMKRVFTWSLWQPALIWSSGRRGRISCCTVWYDHWGLGQVQHFLKEKYLQLPYMAKCN